MLMGNAKVGFTPGQFIQGGYFGGQIVDGGVTYNLFVAPKVGGETTAQHRNTNAAIAGTDSRTDGVTNTSLMVNASATPAGYFCGTLDLNGYTDWYLPAIDELSAIAANLASGLTAVPAFQVGGAEQFALTSGRYWSSTQVLANTTEGWTVLMNTGVSGAQNKSGSFGVRAVRRVVA